MMRNDAESETLLQCIPLDLRNAMRDPEKHDEQNRQGCGVGDDGDPAPTLTKEFVHGVAYEPVCWDEEINAHINISGTMVKGGDGGRHAGVAVPVAFAQNTRDEVRLIGGDGSITGALTAESGMKQANYVAIVECADTLGVGANQTTGFETEVASVGMAVRRLTPRECERLQGFPDDHTAIHGAADGPRYKALGNSMAVPVMRWIGKRIKEANDAR